LGTHHTDVPESGQSFFVAILCEILRVQFGIEHYLRHRESIRRLLLHE
jgi:hypothetical protein